MFSELGDGGLTDVAVATIDSGDTIHGFHILYGVVERYLKEEEPPGSLRIIRWFKSAVIFASLEVVLRVD